MTSEENMDLQRLVQPLNEREFYVCVYYCHNLLAFPIKAIIRDIHKQRYKTFICDR